MAFEDEKFPVVCLWCTDPGCETVGQDRTEEGFVSGKYGVGAKSPGSPGQSADELEAIGSFGDDGLKMGLPSKMMIEGDAQVANCSGERELDTLNSEMKEVRVTTYSGPSTGWDEYNALGFVSVDFKGPSTAP